MRERQYQELLSLRDKQGVATLGLDANYTWHDDPKRLVFVLARYKFVAKMLAGKKHVLEVGCGDAFGTRIVLQSVGSLLAIDFDPVFVEDVRERMDDRWKFVCMEHDILDSPVAGTFDGVYALDVLEHISRNQEDCFMLHMVQSLSTKGVLIIGTPSIQSQAYASRQSKEGHINCKDGKALGELCLKYFHNIFLFSMNDEVVHTGFYPMAHYLFAVCTVKRSGRGKKNRGTKKKRC